MFWKRAGNRYGQAPEPATPYQRAAQVWDDRMGSARVQAKNWRLIALCLVALSFVLAGGLVWRSTQSIVTPYVIELASDGAVRAIGPADGRYEPTDAQIAFHLGAFIQNTRSISIDPIVVRQNWLTAYAYATDRAASTLNDYARDHDPFAEIGRKSVTVDVLSIVRASGDSFTVRWRETAYRNGGEVSRDTWTATLSVITDTPRDADTLHRNPLGLYVHGINWSQDLQGG